MSKSLDGKIAVITGGASGMGLAAAKKLMSEGSECILLDINEVGLTKVKQLLGKKSYGIVCDLVDRESIEKAASEINKVYDKIDFLVNCAGISRQQEQGLLDEQVFQELIDTNLKSVYLSSMIFGYQFMNKNGAIINISSIRGRTGTPSFSSGYAAAKAGVINLSKSFSLELASKKIRVNCIAPGAVYPTGLSKGWSKEFREQISKDIPMKRLGKPEEIANVVYFLASDLSSYITGQTIDVNGGQWMN